MDFEKLRQAAKNEDWDYVDAEVAKLANDPEAMKFAERWLNDQDGNIRDLGATLLEKSKADIKPVKTRLYAIIQRDSHPYAQFRAACALAAHGEKADNVKATLKDFEKDPDVADIAKNYLAKF